MTLTCSWLQATLVRLYDWPDATTELPSWFPVQSSEPTSDRYTCLISRFELFTMFTDVDSCARESSGSEATAQKATQKITRLRRLCEFCELFIILLPSSKKTADISGHEMGPHLRSELRLTDNCRFSNSAAHRSLGSHPRSWASRRWPCR